MRIRASWEFGFMHFYPAIFYIISSFSTFVSKVSYSRIKQKKKYIYINIYIYILLLAQSRDPIVFHGPGLPSIDAPLKRATPKKEPIWMLSMNRTIYEHAQQLHGCHGQYALQRYRVMGSGTRMMEFGQRMLEWSGKVSQLIHAFFIFLFFF